MALEGRKPGEFPRAALIINPINMLEMWTSVSGNNDCQFGRPEGQKK